MKQFTIFNQLTAMPKRLAMVLTVLFTLGVGSVWGLEETITLSSFGWGNATVQSSITATSATISLAKNSAGTDPTYYTSDGLRIYGVKSATTGGTISFTPKKGITISKIVFTHTSSNSGVLAIKTGVGSYSSKTWSGTLTEGNTVSLVSTNSGSSNPQVRITQIVITYTKAAAQTYDVTLSRNGVPETISGVKEGTALDDIDGTGDQGGCAEWSFVGWSKSQRSTQDDSAPMDLVTKVDGAGPYYAVYSHTADGGGGPTTKTISSFFEISGTTGDISYNAYQGGGTTAPAVNSNAIRLYQNSSGATGGYIVLSVPEGYEITSATIKSTMATTTGYYIASNPGNSTPAKANFVVSNKSLSANTEYTVSGLSTQHITFACFGTSSSSRLYLSYLSVTYSGGQTVYYTTNPQCTTETTVTLNADGGAISEDGWETTDGEDTYTKNVETTNENVVLPTPVKEGYTFGGWYKESTFATQVTQIAKGSTGDITLYAKWTINRYTLTWNLNGGKVIVAGTQASVDATGSPSGYVNYNVSVNVPEVAREGHYFTGWTEDGTNVVTPLTKMPARDVTYIALWEEAGCPEYSFHTGGDNVKEINTQICFEPVGSNNEWQIVNYVIPADTKYFVGHHGYWYENNLGSNNSCSVVKTWSEAMYLAPAMDPSNPNGTPKVGQATGAVGTIRIFDNSNWDNLYVGFIPNGYKLKFGTTEYAFTHQSNGEYHSDIVQYNTTSARYNVSAGVINGSNGYVATNNTQEMQHIFLNTGGTNLWGADNVTNFGLYDITNSQFTCLMVKVPGEDNLYEGWVPSNCKKVIFVRLSNSTPSWDNKYNQTGDVSLENNKNLFTITQWNDQTSGWSAYTQKGKFRMNDNYKDKNWYVRFYPHYVVNYDANGGDGTMEMQAVPKDALDKKVTIADCGFTRTGYNFVKWNKNASGTSTSYNPGATYTLSADVILYAQWEAQTYNITYKDQGNVAYSGSNAASLPNTHTYATATTLVDGVKMGYTFGGWYDNPECTGTAITQLGATDYTADITLYAKWTANTYTITFNAGTGECGTESVTTTNASGVTLPTASHTCTDWTFAGWATASVTETTTTPNPLYAAGSSYKPTSNTTLYAVYTTNETTQGGGSGNYELVTSAPADWSGTYLIVNTDDKKAWKGSATSDNGAIDVTITNNTIPSNATTDNETFTIATMTGGYSIKGTSGKYISGTSGSNATDYNAVAQLNTISIDNNNNVTITSNTSVLRQNNSNASLFRYYKSSSYSSQHPIQLYKKSTGSGSTTYYHSTPDCGPSCEQLGAATGLTVETDFVHTDGQTYVKFSWTPANNTKNNAVSQKLCFGKVGEAGTCVDDLEKNLTWTGDLKSKLEPGEYWWSIQALGDGVNYCDGDVVNGTNFTIEAPTYTVEWFVNGEEAKGTPTTLVIAGQKVTVLPTTPTSADCDDNKVFVGWTDTEINGTSANAPTNLYKELGDFPAINANTIYYAVFATEEGGGGSTGETTTVAVGDQVVIIQVDNNTTELTGFRSDKVITDNNNYGTHAAYNTTPSATLVWTIEEGASNGTFAFKNDDYYLNLGDNENYLSCSTTKNANSSWTITESNGRAVVANVQYPTRKIMWNQSSPRFASYAKNHGLNTNQYYYHIKFYKLNGGTSYSDYVTSCVALPDPVISFVTTPADPIVFDPVNCGSTTTKAQAKTVQVSGVNLQEYVSVEVTGPYKIARTSSTNLSDYTTSLTLDKTNTGNINANYSTIYIISCPPAQSTDATTGTLTFTTKKGNTLTVNLSTPTVNCTTYALTFNDRGNKTVENYYAGVEVPQPVDPTGVCTEPIHYVFDGWAEATVANGSTEYTKVTFPYSMPGQNKTLYAVYRYLTSGGNGDYNLVTSALDDWSGDYLIAYSDLIFANGKIGGKDGIGAAGEKVDLSSYITNNTIPAAEGDKYKVSLEAINGGYLLKTQDGQYNYQSSNTNGLEATTNKNTATNYKLSVNFVSFEEINLCLSGNAEGAIFQYNTDQQGYFRFYKNGGQEPVHLYKKASGTTLYTSAPVCGPLVEITSDKDIYVTGGKGVHSTVVAQKKITFSATRLQPNAGGNAPSIKVPAADITIAGTPTTKVDLSITQNMEEQGDGTYAGTGEITITYTPTEYNVNEDINVQLRAEYNTGSDVILDAFTIHARSLPEEFVIVAKQGDKWYALNGDMSNGSSANPANGQITLNDDANPTQATYAPCNTIYTFDGLPNTGDRTRVRFQGTDGAWLWAASGTNVGIQNKTLAQTPTGDNKPYNWKLETEDNITYKFHNDNSSRLLGLSGEKFGMYASGIQEFRILPYVEKCLYNYAPTNLKVSVLKGTSVTLTWDAVAGATKYQYSADGNTWTDAGTEPTVTISGLDGDTEYIYLIRAYHEDAGVTNECIDYAEITFTTANCDDVPTNITYTADLNSITVSWTAAAPTATITYNTKEDGTGGGGTCSGATSPYKISGGLTKNTTYYIQILSDGTCASPIIPVKTEDVEVDIVEWYPQGIIVDINTDETVSVSLENEVSYGSGAGAEATELFFSKYYEATTNVKLVAIYNGTKNLIDLTDYQIHYGKTSWESNYITLKDFGATKGQIQPGEEIILYSKTDGNTSDESIMDCVHDDYPDGKWVQVTQKNNDGKGHLAFAGDKTIVLKKAGTVIDVIGALTSGGLPTNNAVTQPSWGDANGWTCATGLSIADDTQIGISTNRCLLIRNNSVTSGENAVTSNIDDFVTLCSEWKGAQVPDNNVDNGVAASCENFAYVGTFDYSDYYTQYESMGDEKEFDENARNADGTVTIPITDLYKQSCRNIRIKLSNSNGDVLTDREYKVPIMITTTQGTDGQTFIDLQQNLATKEVDGDGNVIDTHPLSLEDVREICKTCDVVVRDNATLTKVTDGTTNDHPQVRNVYVYEGASIVIPDGNNHNYTINGLSLRRKGDEVASAQVQGTGKFVLPADEPVCLDLRVDANNWHWFTLPYDCLIEDVTWVDGTPAKYNTDWFLMYYDGESRAASTNPYDNHWKVYNGTTIEAGKGYIVGITGDLAHPSYTFELRFPMAQEVLTDEQTDKTVPVNAWGVKSDNKPNNLGWNLVGCPYLNYYQPKTTGFSGLPLIQYTSSDLVVGEFYEEEKGNIPFLVTPIDGGWYEYRQELASEVNMMPFTAYFVQVGDPNTHSNGQALDASFEASNRGKKSIVRRAPREVEEIEEPIIVRVELTNSKGESDKTSLVIDQRFTNEYEMNGDFFKWFGDYYNYYTKPVLYTIGADQGKRAFNALNEELAKQPIPVGMYAAQAGNYTFSLNQQFDLSRVEEVWLYDATQSTYTNLMQSDYTFSTSKVNGAGRFSLSVKLAPKVATGMENVNADKVWATTQNQQIIVNGLENNTQLWMYDAAGKLLYTEVTSNYQHRYSVPQVGTYFIALQKGTTKQTIKVVVE